MAEDCPHFLPLKDYSNFQSTTKRKSAFNLIYDRSKYIEINITNLKNKRFSTVNF